MSKKIILTGAIFIMLAIVLGAMAAHGLEKVVSENLIVTFEKGVKYQMYSGLGLLIIGLNTAKLNISTTFFYYLNLIGVILFSGSIYLYALHEITPVLKPFAMVVPFGGVAMISAWIVLSIQIIRKI